MSAYKELEKRFAKLSHLQHLQAIAGWDEAVMMPVGGECARAKALATLKVIQHECLTAPDNLDLIAQSEQEALSSPWQKANLKLIKKAVQNATCLPSDLVHASAKATLECEQAWRKQRADNNWKDFAPRLKEVVRLTKESAQIRSQVFNLSPYDVAIDDFSPGFSQKTIDPLFAQLKATLPDIIENTLSQQARPQKPQGPFAIEQQKQLGLALMKAIGFNFEHGRLDVSHHPFCGGVAQDVRITTRYNDHEFFSSAMGICHETGHACYEQHLPREWLEQPVGLAHSMAMHESQSLLIEMQACRSHEFMQFLAPLAIQHFGNDPALTANNLYLNYTHVEKGLIRVDADELTYPLHVILRYELEQALFNDELSVDALPAAWNEKMQASLGLSTLGNDADGVMQDVHWPSGAFGYFPAYTLGAMIAAQLFQKATQEKPAIPSEIAKGHFSTLMQWLANNVHQYGAAYSTADILSKATGETLQSGPFLAHLKARYLNQ